ncbi:MAG: biotin transporter BioY [Oscillospiraceae bacterium]
MSARKLSIYRAAGRIDGGRRVYSYSDRDLRYHPAVPVYRHGGVLLGPGGGALSQGVYVALGLVGLPIFTAGGGFGYVLQPSFGFLLGLIPTAAVIGALSRRSSSPVRLALACGAGLAVLYAVGVPYMALILNGYLGKGISAPALLWSGMLIYLPGDAAKIAVTALLCPVLRRRIPGLR